MSEPEDQIQQFGQVWIKIEEEFPEDVSENHNGPSEDSALPNHSHREKLSENTPTKRSKRHTKQSKDVKEMSVTPTRRPNREKISNTTHDYHLKSTVKKPKNEFENITNVCSTNCDTQQMDSVAIKEEIIENVDDSSDENLCSETDPIRTKPCTETNYPKTVKRKSRTNVDSTEEDERSQLPNEQAMDTNDEIMTIEVDVDRVIMDNDEDDDDWNEHKPARKRNGKGKRRQYERRKRSPGQSLMCDHCDYTTKHHALLLRHIIQHKVKDKCEDLQSYECDQCEYKSFFKTNYVAHVRRKHPTEQTKDKKFKCNLCDFASAYHYNFQKHLKIHGPKENTLYKCDKCHFVTKFEGFITRHLSQVHNEVLDRANKCDNCNFITKARFRLNVHRKRSYRENPLKCDYCPLTTSYMCEFKLHRAMHVASKSLINTSFTDNLDHDNMENPDHVDQDNVDKPHEDINENADQDSTNNTRQDFTVKPEHCFPDSSDRTLITSEPDLNTFDYFQTLKPPDMAAMDHTNMNVFYRTNVNSVHQANVNSFHQANINNGDQTNLNRVDHTNLNSVHQAIVNSVHQAIVNNFQQTNLNSNQANVKPNQAQSKNTDTNKATKRKNNGEFLINTDHSKDSKNIPVRELLVGTERHFGCPECEYTSKFKGSVQRHHFRIHVHDIKPYKCVHCDYETKTRDKITLHTKRSTSQIALKCLHCDFNSNYKCELNLHQKSHSNFKCDVCKEGFSSAATLRTHFSLVHLNNGLKCRVCDFVAIRRESLISHEATHTGFKPFQCKHCDYGCMTSRSLQNHRIKHHGLEAEKIVYIDDSQIKKLIVEPNDLGILT